MTAFQSIMTDRLAMAGIRDSVFFSHFPESDRQRILAHAYVVGKADFRELDANGEGYDRLLLIVEGYVGIYDGDAEDNHLIDILGPGDFIGLPEILLDRRINHSMAPIGDIRLAVIPAETLREMIASSGHIAISLLSELSDRLRSLINQVAALKTMTASQRIANFLLNVAASKVGREQLPQRQNPLSFHLPFSKKLIAAQLGITPESFSRSLPKLNASGIHFDKDMVRIENPALLHERIRARWRN